jgi:hypothetical protein
MMISLLAPRLQFEVVWDGARTDDSTQWIFESDMLDGDMYRKYCSVEAPRIARLRKKMRTAQAKTAALAPQHLAPEARISALRAYIDTSILKAVTDQAVLDTVSIAGPTLCNIDGAPIIPTSDPIVPTLRRIRLQLTHPCQPVARMVRLERQVSTVTDGHFKISALLAAAALPPDRISLAGITPPRTISEALSSINGPAWAQAIQAEFGSFETMGVWRLVPYPTGRNVMKCKWIFDFKTDPDNRLLRLKARLTACGYSQVLGEDYDATFAPTCRMRTLRALLVEAATSPGFRTAQWDAKCAFLQADADKEMYMLQPEGMVVPGKETMVYELIKSVYGTKQAGRLFSQMVRAALLSTGATQSDADECLYTWSGPAGVMRALVHVDDFAITYTDEAKYAEVLAVMKETFVGGFTAEPTLNYFLGVVIDRQPTGEFRIHQAPYILDIIKRIGIPLASNVQSPEAPGTANTLRAQDGPLSSSEALYMETVPYKQAVAGLFYLARATRWDISHAVARVAKFMANPNRSHWHAVIRIYAFLKATSTLALRLGTPGDTKIQLSAAADADWAGDRDDRKSHSGWLVHCNTSLVAWLSKAQRSIAQSTSEAELIALTSCANEVIWWRILLQDLGHDQTGPTTIFEDNQATVSLAHHSGRFDATKHISIKHLTIREYIDQGLLDVQWIPGSSQTADMLTKAVGIAPFRDTTQRLMREDFPPITLP